MFGTWDSRRGKEDPKYQKILAAASHKAKCVCYRELQCSPRGVYIRSSIWLLVKAMWGGRTGRELQQTFIQYSIEQENASKRGHVPREYTPKVAQNLNIKRHALTRVHKTKAINALHHRIPSGTGPGELGLPARENSRISAKILLF